MATIVLYGKSKSGKNTFKEMAIINEFKITFSNVPQIGCIKVRINRQYELRGNNLGEFSLIDNYDWIDLIPNEEFDFIINNNGSLELFEGAVISVLNSIMRKNNET